MLSATNTASSCNVCSRIISPVQVYACDSCISGSKSPSYSDYSYSGYTCTLCLQEDARILWFQSDTCMACQCQKAHPKDAKVLFLQQFNPSPLNDNFTGDVYIFVEGSDQPVQAHRLILASKSPVFDKMMTINMKEKLSGTIQIAGFSALVVRAAVNFMYMGEIEFSDQVRSQDVLSFAHQYEIQWLKDLCEADLVKNLNKENLLEMLSISYRFEAELLKRKAKKFFTDHSDVHDGILDSMFTNSLN